MILALAMILDALFGEPRWLWSRVPHPAVLMGRAIGWADLKFNNGNQRKAKGILVLLGLLAIAWVIGAGISLLPMHHILEVVVAAILLAQRSLVDHVRNVATAMQLSTGDGRRAIAHIVGRDTSEMDQPAIARAAIESAAENFSDGIAAPIFWFAVFGLPGMLMYKMVNTADSMIGYRTPRHQDFGWAAARFDDLLNWVPARLTATLLTLIGGRIGEWGDIVGDARLHRSPNAGWPEAAMARTLGVALSGPRSYHGTLQDDPFVNSTGNRFADAGDVKASVRALWQIWAVILVAALVCAGV